MKMESNSLNKNITLTRDPFENTKMHVQMCLPSHTNLQGSSLITFLYTIQKAGWKITFTQP
jgi:hypothetical protein